MTTQERIARGDDLYTLMTHVPGEDFGSHPLCADEDPDLHFPVSEDISLPLIREQVEQAKAVCEECPLKAVCRENAINRGSEGIWGATTTAERAEIRRERGLSGKRRRQVEPLTAREVSAGAGRVLEDLEQLQGERLPLLRKQVRQALYQARRRGDGADQQAAAVMRLVQPEIDWLSNKQDSQDQEAA